MGRVAGLAFALALGLTREGGGGLRCVVASELYLYAG